MAVPVTLRIGSRWPWHGHALLWMSCYVFVFWHLFRSETDLVLICRIPTNIFCETRQSFKIPMTLLFLMKKGKTTLYVLISPTALLQGILSRLVLPWQKAWWRHLHLWTHLACWIYACPNRNQMHVRPKQMCHLRYVPWHCNKSSLWGRFPWALLAIGK